MINAALRATVAQSTSQGADEQPLTIAALRRVLREELNPA
jgi:hypothetical protein